ncbi:MAG: ATP-binding protein [Syntrophales bacterium]|nr:ATP-binding protein [Syntrophales bacterium]
MKSLQALAKFQFRGSNPIPIYSKLSFHNKILLIILFLLMLFGLLGAIALQLILKVHFAMDTFIEQVMTLYMGILAVMIVITFLIARPFLKYTTSPIITLTRITDEISLGNLDISIFFGQHVNCWEIKKCGRRDCAAYKNTAIQCWFVNGTPCEGYEPKFPQKLKGCRKCEVYKTHKGDEIVQLADSFQHMIYMLKTSQAELEKSHKFQSNMIQNSLIGIIATNEIGVVKIFNRVAENLSGYDESEVTDKLTLDNFFSKDIATKINRPLIYDYGLELRGFKPTESEILNKDKEPIPVRLSGINLYEEGEHLGKVFFFQDLREIRRLRQELIQSERLSATGEAVASISHSIKNILDGLLGGVYVYKMGSRINDEKGTQKGWRMIEKNIDLISELVINLLNYAKERDPIFQKCTPQDIVEDVIEAMENKARNKNIDIVSEYKGYFDNIYMDSHALHQCLMNLVSNAIDAIPPGRPGHIIVRLESKNEEGIVLEVSDNGVGMSKEIHNKIFQGMFSTKGSTGTGLGLLVVKKIVSEHGGMIDVNSEEDRGSTFTIWLPNNSPNIRVSDSQ